MAQAGDATPSKRARASREANSVGDVVAATPRRQSASSPTSIAAAAPRSSTENRRKSRRSVGANAESDPRFDKRLVALNKAVDKFLELIDEAATPENFATTLSQVPQESLESIRLKLISGLKDDIKAQHLDLVEEFNLDSKLEELQRLTEEADARAAAAEGQEHATDLWKAGVDISNAVDAKGLEAQRESVAKVRRELEETRAANSQLYKALEANLGESQSQQDETAAFFRALDHAADSLLDEETAELQAQIKGNFYALSEELGPRVV